MRLTPGTRVGPYEVVSLLGAGGMAEVYRAKDTRLGRDVAIKVVSEALGADGAFLERFDREAKLAASLAHPNVVALHDVGFHDGKPYFVTELLQGESLRERLAKGPVILKDASLVEIKADHHHRMGEVGKNLFVIFWNGDGGYARGDTIAEIYERQAIVEKGNITVIKDEAPN